MFTRFTLRTLLVLSSIFLSGLTASAWAATLNLSANPATVASGGATTLSWSGTDLSTCTASGGWSGVKAVSGSETVSGLTATTRFNLNCRATTGGSIRKSVRVSVTAALPTVSLSASPTSVATGGSSTLTWSSTNATSCTASGAWSGSRVTSGNQSTGVLTATSTYTLSCTGAGGSASQSTTVTVMPVGGSLTVGYNDASRTITAATVVLDLAQPAPGNYPVWVSGVGYPNLIRPATHEVLPGGYFARGYSRFSPGHVNDGGRGEHYCGIGQIFGFNAVGDSSQVVVGQLVRFGTTFFTDQISPNSINGDIKELILLNDSGERPMILTKGGVTRVLGACDGTVCNTTGSIDNIDYHNDQNNQPDINAYLGQWLWVEFHFNSNVPFTRTRVWSADGVLQGAEIIAPWASPGRVTALDIVGFVNAIPVPGGQPYYDLERVEFRVGSDANITPPTGFPGSLR